MRPRARRLLLTIAVPFVLITIFTLVFLHRREPMYRGKPLTAWAQQYGSNRWSGRRDLSDEAELAVRQIGTNKSIPFLVNLMRATDTPLKKKLRRLLPGKWHAALHLIDDSGTVRRIGAHGIAALGTNASAAVPTLIDLAKTLPDPDGRYIAVWTLMCIGPGAEPAIPFTFNVSRTASPPSDATPLRGSSAFRLNGTRLRRTSSDTLTRSRCPVTPTAIGKHIMPSNSSAKWALMRNPPSRHCFRS